MAQTEEESGQTQRTAFSALTVGSLSTSKLRSYIRKQGLAYTKLWTTTYSEWLSRKRAQTTNPI